MNELDRLFADARSPEDFACRYLAHVTQVLARVDPLAVARLIDLVLAARNRNSRIYFMGNGGSAATASHFANDLASGTHSWHRPFRASSLADSSPLLTALANDFGYDEVFRRQLMVLLQPGDVVVAISASGNSPNVVNAIEYANDHGARTAALTAFDGGRLAHIAQVVVHVPTEPGEYGPAEDAHMVVDHLVSAYLCARCRDGAAGEG